MIDVIAFDHDIFKLYKYGSWERKYVYCKVHILKYKNKFTD